MQQVVVSDTQYETLTLIDFLDFFNQPYQLFPTVRINSDVFWKEELMKMIESLDKGEEQQKVTCVTPVEENEQKNEWMNELL